LTAAQRQPPGDRTPLIHLGFEYPPRAEFFPFRQSQIVHGGGPRAARMNPLELNAPTLAPWLSPAVYRPTSYQAFAVDFDDDGKADTGNHPSIIGSVANYFNESTAGKHGAGVAVGGQGQWRSGLPKAMTLRNRKKVFETHRISVAELIDLGWEPNWSSMAQSKSWR